MKTRERELTPLLVAASYNRKNAVLWLLQDAESKVKGDVVDVTDGRNAIHLASLDLQCQYTIEVSDHLQLPLIGTYVHVMSYIYALHICMCHEHNFNARNFCC